MEPAVVHHVDAAAVGEAADLRRHVHLRPLAEDEADAAGAAWPSSTVWGPTRWEAVTLPGGYAVTVPLLA